MNHKLNLDYIIFWSSLLTVLVINHKANGIFTDSNDLQCTHIQCPKKCPEDSYLKSAHDDEEEDFDDYEDELLGHDPYIEEIGHFEAIPPLEELHDDHSPQHMLKERQKREVFFQQDIEKCCHDEKCVCNKCQDVPKCAEDYVAVEILEGQGVPGNCCSIFRCVKKEPCQLGVKQSWWTNKCRKCSCFGENELCMQICPEEEILQNCYSDYWHKPMMNGAFWKEGSCTSCSCEQGERRCFTPVCPKLYCKQTIRFEDECCPKCMDEETDASAEIVHNEEHNFDEIEEEYSTDVTTIETPIVNGNENHNSSFSPNYSSFPVTQENEVKETQTTSPFVESEEYATVSSATEEIIKEISSTLKLALPESTTATSLEVSNSTAAPISENTSTTVEYREDSTAEVLKAHKSLTIVNTTTTTTEGPKLTQDKEVDFTIGHTFTESPTSTVVTQQQHSSSTPSTTEEVEITSTTSTDATEDLATVATNTSQENSSPTSYNFSSQKTGMANITATPAEVTTAIISDKFTEVDNTFTTNEPTDSPVISSVKFSSTSPASTNSPSSSESTTTNTISSSTQPQTSTSYPRNTPTDSTWSTTAATSSTSTEHFKANTTSTTTAATSSTSTEHFTAHTTSTTSSPYTLNSDSTTTTTTTFDTEESTSTSTTKSPEPLRPLFQSYGDIIADEGRSSTQNQMRIMFDEIDYVVMIVLFIGSLLCISLGLIIRHTKNRKKMYSSIPNSETSLSQTSTNTVMTV